MEPFWGALVHRYYDPPTAQFLSVDPAVDETGTPYAFTNDDPVNESDALGLWSLNPISDVTEAAADVGHAVTAVAADSGRWVYQNSSTLSTIASGIATVAYIACGVTEGVGCGVGLAFSALSSSLSGANAYRACISGAGGCTSALLEFGVSLGATGLGALAQAAAANSLNMANDYARDIYLARQAAVIGAGANGLSFLFDLGELLSHNLASSNSACGLT